MELIILFFWVMFSIIVGLAATSRGRSGGWFILALISSPLLALLLFATSANAQEEEWVRPDTYMNWSFFVREPGTYVQFWSANRTSKTWGPYRLRTYAETGGAAQVTFACKEGEKICFGAWTEVKIRPWSGAWVGPTRNAAPAPAAAATVMVGARRLRIHCLRWIDVDSSRACDPEEVEISRRAPPWQQVWQCNDIRVTIRGSR
jgi:hypothetical protein